MCAAARTAPKAHGKDTMHTLILTGDEKEQLAKKMEEFGIREMGRQNEHLVQQGRCQHPPGTCGRSHWHGADIPRRAPLRLLRL